MSTVIGRVVVGVDGSPGSLQALRFAVREARAAEAVLVPVIAWLPPGGDISNRSYPVALARELRTEAEHDLLTAFDEALGGVPADLRVEPQVVRGRASRVLVAVADQTDDVLITGRGHSIVRRVLYGSVARYCLSHAHCPVVAVPPAAIPRGLWRTRWGLRLRGVPSGLVEDQRAHHGRSDAGHDTLTP